MTEIKSALTLASLTSHLINIDHDLHLVGVDYAFIGGIALMPHNYIRMTQDIDILVSKATVGNLSKLHGRGYTLRPGATHSLYLHVVGQNVPLDVLVEGQKEGEASMPNPVLIRTRINGVWYADLPNLIKLKLLANRPRDLQDVIQLIDLNMLTSTFAFNLPEHLRDPFLGLLGD